MSIASLVEEGEINQDLSILIKTFLFVSSQELFSVFTIAVIILNLPKSKELDKVSGLR